MSETVGPVEVPITNRRGLHARASAKFVTVASSFDAEVTVSHDGSSVTGTSIMGLMMLAAAMGDIGGWPDPRGRYDGPVLVLSGDASDYVLPEHRDAFLRLFPAAGFATIPAGHWLHAENPAAFLAAVRGLLAGS